MAAEKIKRYNIHFLLKGQLDPHSLLGSVVIYAKERSEAIRLFLDAIKNKKITNAGVDPDDKYFEDHITVCVLPNSRRLDHKTEQEYLKLFYQKQLEALYGNKGEKNENKN